MGGLCCKRGTSVGVFVFWVKFDFMTSLSVATRVVESYAPFLSGFVRELRCSGNEL